MSAVFLRLLAQGTAFGLTRAVGPNPEPAAASALVVVTALAAITLSACSGGSTGTPLSAAAGPAGDAAGGSPASLDTQIACRQRVNEMFERRERAEIYAPASQMNTPFSANYTPDVPNRGLANQFAYEKTKNECERNVGTGAVRLDTSAPAPPAPTRR